MMHFMPFESFQESANLRKGGANSASSPCIYSVDECISCQFLSKCVNDLQFWNFFSNLSILKILGGVRMNNFSNFFARSQFEKDFQACFNNSCYSQVKTQKINHIFEVFCLIPNHRNCGTVVRQLLIQPIVIVNAKNKHRPLFSQSRFPNMYIQFL